MKIRCRVTWQLSIILVALGTALGVRSTHAGEIVQFYDLVLTENSSTDLSFTYNGPSGSGAFTVIPVAPDQWKLRINSAEFLLRLSITSGRNPKIH
ncbi:MAG TPA: hypothetical protein VGM62_11480 [Chthoniobacterales bacterium]|jgi:hypothetical protein